MRLSASSRIFKLSKGHLFKRRYREAVRNSRKCGNEQIKWNQIYIFRCGWWIAKLWLLSSEHSAANYWVVFNARIMPSRFAPNKNKVFRGQRIVCDIRGQFTFVNRQIMRKNMLFYMFNAHYLINDHWNVRHLYEQIRINNSILKTHK